MTVHLKIDFIDVIIFLFALGTVDGIELGIIEKTDLGYLIFYHKVSIEDKLDGSLDVI